MAFNVALMSIEERQSSMRAHDLLLYMRLAREEYEFFDRNSADIEKEQRGSP
jgi:hypothetical protein